ncbi:ATP-binding protein [Streptacidiphilus sp. PB12-B1b]|uniref:ATP-binding protein n=1 Tax=Streptacidiphilus sp. PB12-B1b TaxID=2705012 RepID=UPI001CDBF43C|nr:ATP-binding protein [Streptacidiphilus sp. PB12-B1b]
MRAARARARDVACRWGLDELADDLESVIGELVTNAVVHGRAARGSRVAVTYYLINEGLRVEVRDWASGTPRVGSPPALGWHSRKRPWPGHGPCLEPPMGRDPSRHRQNRVVRDGCQTKLKGMGYGR